MAFGYRCTAQHDALCRHVVIWEKQRNSAYAKITWQFTAGQVRTEPKGRHPSLMDDAMAKLTFQDVTFPATRKPRLDSLTLIHTA